jgi:hypothetical protein
MTKPNQKSVKILSLVTGILGVLTLLWLVFDLAMYNRLKPLTLQLKELGRLEALAEFIWLSFIFMFFYHLLAAGTLVMQLRFLRKIRPLSILAIVIGVVSFLGLFSDWAVLGDISKEYKMGWDTTGEWKILYIILGIHTVFVLLVTGISTGTFYIIRRSPGETDVPARDEIVFVIAQYVGIACGLIGIAFVIMGMIVSRNVPVSVYHSISSTVLTLIPYGLIVSYWLALRLRDRIGGWYDEKQYRDITRAGFMTLVLLIPTLLLFVIAISLSGQRYPTPWLWFPFTLFTILLFFSAFTLLNYRRG